jgi:hypothetical protein
MPFRELGAALTAKIVLRKVTRVKCTNGAILAFVMNIRSSGKIAIPFETHVLIPCLYSDTAVRAGAQFVGFGYLTM